jgi:hypothetical protein
MFVGFKLKTLLYLFFGRTIHPLKRIIISELGHYCIFVNKKELAYTLLQAFSVFPAIYLLYTASTKSLSPTSVFHIVCFIFQNPICFVFYIPTFANPPQLQIKLSLFSLSFVLFILGFPGRLHLR